MGIKMVRHLVFGAWVVLLAGQNALAQNAEWNPALFKPSDKAFVQQEGYYHLVIPQGFTCEEKKRRLECRSAKGDSALLHIEVVDIPAKGTLELVALNYERRFQKKSHYQLLQKSKLTVDGTPAVLHSLRYDYLGNVQTPVAVQALYLVRQNKLFLIHFECALQYFSAYVPALGKLYGTFKPAQIDPGGHPMLPRAKQKKNSTKGKPPVPDNLKPFLDGRRF